MSGRLPDNFISLAEAFSQPSGRFVNVIGIVTDGGGEPTTTRKGGRVTKQACHVTCTI